MDMRWTWTMRYFYNFSLTTVTFISRMNQKNNSGSYTMQNKFSLHAKPYFHPYYLMYPLGKYFSKFHQKHIARMHSSLYHTCKRSLDDFPNPGRYSASDHSQWSPLPPVKHYLPPLLPTSAWLTIASMHDWSICSPVANENLLKLSRDDVSRCWNHWKKLITVLRMKGVTDIFFGASIPW